MRSLLLSGLLLFANCASIRTVSDYVHCGSVDVLSVQVRKGAISCDNALRITNQAYELLWQEAAGPLNDSWRVEYTWGEIDVTGASAKIDPQEHAIFVKGSSPENVFHELLHAYLTETHSGGRNQHRTMCENARWQKLEKDFGVAPYCHLMYLKLLTF